MQPSLYYASEPLSFVPTGVVGWMVMETVSPIIFISTYLLAPFSSDGHPPSLGHPSTLLAVLFVAHYLNRAIISPLRSPGRSETHVIVVAAAMIFNMINPCLVAAFLSAPNNIPCPLEPSVLLQSLEKYVPGSLWLGSRLLCKHESRALSWTSPTFIAGVTAFVIGFALNILHDEILYDLRRNTPPRSDGKQTYAIPRGALYEYISYPNYFCEWVEWIGFALAASPRWQYTPPWMFVVAELMVMLPRAYKGHQWYLERFPDYPKFRKAVIPFIL